MFVCGGGEDPSVPGTYFLNNVYAVYNEQQHASVCLTIMFFERHKGT